MEGGSFRIVHLLCFAATNAALSLSLIRKLASLLALLHHLPDRWTGSILTELWPWKITIYGMFGQTRQA